MCAWSKGSKQTSASTPPKKSWTRPPCYTIIWPDGDRTLTVLMKRRYDLRKLAEREQFMRDAYVAGYTDLWGPESVRLSHGFKIHYSGGK